MGHAHAACLTAWVQESGSLTCERCKQRYQEPYVQALGLAAAAAADKTRHKDGVNPAAAAAAAAAAAVDVNHHTCQPWLSL
jgi:hypothetical protein